MLTKMRKMKMNRNMAYLIIIVLALAFILTNANSVNQQAQYTIHNEITAAAYVYSDDGNPNTASNAADQNIQIMVTLDDLTGVTGISASIYDLNDNYMGITVDLVVASADSYISDLVDVSGLAEIRLFVIGQVMATGETVVNQPGKVEIYIDHPAQDITYTFAAYQNDIVISETEEVSGVIVIKVEILTGVATDGYMHIYRGTKDVEFGDKIDTILGIDALIAGYTFDGNNYETGDYWVSISVTGTSDWTGFQDSLAINLRTTALDPISSDIKVYNFENDVWVFVEEPGTLHDTIMVTAKVVTGLSTSYVLDIVDDAGGAVGTYAFVYDSVDDIWILEFNTRTLANGIYTFGISAIDSDGQVVPQSAWSLGIWEPGDPAEESNWFIWVGAFGIIVIVIFVTYMKKRAAF